LGAATKAVSTVAAGQAIATLVCVGVAAALGGTQAAWSAAVGGGISILATLFFALRAMGPGGEPALTTLVGRFYVAEAQKLLLTAVLFYVAVRWLEVSFLPMMAAFALTLVVFWLALLPVLSGPHD
jgi:ATP synthase protein I